MILRIKGGRPARSSGLSPSFSASASICFCNRSNIPLMAPRGESEQLGHGDRFGLRLTFAAPEHICHRQSFGGVVAAKKHGNETGHLACMVPAHSPSAKRADRTRIIFTE